MTRSPRRSRPSLGRALRGRSALAIPGGLALALVAGSASTSWADPPNGPGLLRALGPRAQRMIEPRSTTMGAVVRVGSATDLEALGLHPLAPGFARMRGTAGELLAFADAHPDLPLEVAPPPHLLLNLVGKWTHATEARQQYGVNGSTSLVGVADTGVAFDLKDFQDANGNTRVAWLLDFSVPCQGNYPDLEEEFSDCHGNPPGGGIFAAVDIDQILGGFDSEDFDAGKLTDYVGHGSHVTSIAAGNGGGGPYVGIAPDAGLIIARITRDTTDNIATDDLLAGVSFLFDRADALRMPIAVNLSIGSDFGPHDGTEAWEEALAAHVGPTQPGHALFAAAGNSGDITSEGVHTSIYVPPGDTRSVPISCPYGGSAAGQGQVQVWVTMRGDAQLAVGLDSPTGTWIAPVGANQVGGYPSYDAADMGGMVSATVDNGAAVSGGQIPVGSNSAIVIWGDGDFDAGVYSITLEGGTNGGVADLWVEGSGDALGPDGDGVNFEYPVREGTVNIPATNPGIIAVGCTVNRPSWTSIDSNFVTIALSPLDPRGGYSIDGGSHYPVSGDVCWFSSAGPTVTGVQKPEISAPGGVVIGAMSAFAIPSSNLYDSIFDNPDCPSLVDGGPPDPSCMVIDATHAIAAGTSMSAPQAAGAAALLFDKDPTLTQDKIMGLLQAGAHRFRSGPQLFQDQGGPGELDVQGSLDALDQAQNPANVLPSYPDSWITLSADELTANGSTPLTAIVELRTVGGAHRADFFDAGRLTPVVELDNQPMSKVPPLVRRGPGVWVFTVTPPAGLGGHTVTFGANFDGAPIVAPQTLAIATDVWTANYPASSAGSCGLTRARPTTDFPWWPAAAGLALALARRRRRYSDASDTVQPWGSSR